ncbi:MAG: bifunctional heptose 7-phosphate kinase/heptose 1-phosphate adenyltransferase [Flammeovirgaceae bacterium]
MANIQHVFDSFEKLKVLIIGDVMIDSYIWGKVNRISPEAPVPIVNVQTREKRLGGAANVALNVKALGAHPILCSVVGDDSESQTLNELISDQFITGKGIIKSAERVTTIKHRVLAGSQHMMRIDSEIDTPISKHDAERLIEKATTLMDGVHVIIFEDYDKGVLTNEVISEIIHQAKKRGIPTVVDPKKRNFLAYEGCSLFKPNLKELKEGLKIDMRNKVEEVKFAVRQLRNVMNVDAALITLSENGVYITDYMDEHHIPAHKREISDVSGAGDTVVSIAALCLAAGLSLPQVAGIANLGGGLVCEHLGVVPIEKDRLLEEAMKHYEDR